MARSTSQQRVLACQQVLLEDSSVFSVQWLILPHELGAELSPAAILERYLDHIRRFTLFLIRPRVEEGRITFCLALTPFALLEFHGPLSFSENGKQGARLTICGGILVQQTMCDHGELTVTTEKTEEGLKVTLQLSDYCPLLLGSPRPSLWRRWLYRFTQAAIHKIVTVRFLLRLYRELAGPGVCVQVVPVHVREGRKT